MSSHNIEVGDQVRVTGSFTTNGVLVDPSAVNMQVTTPSGTATVYTYAAAQVTKDSTGTYSLLVTASEAGTWKVRCYSTGTGQAAETLHFKVDAS